MPRNGRSQAAAEESHGEALDGTRTTGRAIADAATNADRQKQVEQEHELAAENALLHREVEERAAQLAAMESALRNTEVELRRLNAELEQRVRTRTERLEEANRELEAFSYSVSHDLRAPLRHIAGFAGLLSRRAGDALDATSRSYVEAIADAARSGGRMVDELLAFSRMARVEMLHRPVDLGSLVRELLGDLALEIQGRQVTWRVGPLPEVRGDPSMLRLAMRNLLANSVKYTRPRPAACIEVTALERPGEIEVMVRDDGVGFDMRHAHKLFGVFQRLHPPEEFEGTGIGLANVRRIVARHGGQTWAEGIPGRGATFHFTLPRRPGEPEER